MTWFRQSEEWEVSWKTISYRWLKLLSCGVLLVFALVCWWLLGARFLAMIQDLRQTDLPVVVEQSHPKTLELTEIDGKILIKRAPPAGWEAAAQGDPIHQGAILQIGHQSSATLNVNGIFRAEIDPDSLMVVEQAESSGNGSRLALRLIAGNVVFDTAEIPRGLEPQLLIADAVVLPVSHSRGYLAASQRGGSYSVVLLQGAGELRRMDEGIRLEPLTRFTLLVDDPELQRRAELTPPVVLAPEQGEIVSGACREFLSLTWDGVEGASSYRVRVATDRYFTNVVSNRTVRNTSLQVQLPPETYFWQVAPIDGSQKVSISSSVHKFQRVCNADARVPVKASPDS